ncbi:hypothetical protein RRG08_012216 [Elysia crispata]|uniref:Uncharacterized protein n=1 Tax=Elysia crispata TaxID=231223 RepID=A0AAE0Z7S1_9GAST|nr:hypothetical protein RRG08_012216 [Elysia crispata]
MYGPGGMLCPCRKCLETSVHGTTWPRILNSRIYFGKPYAMLHVTMSEQFMDCSNHKASLHLIFEACQTGGILPQTSRRYKPNPGVSLLLVLFQADEKC